MTLRRSRIGGWTKPIGIVMMCTLGAGVAIEAADRLWALRLRSKRLATYALLERVRPGMSRAEVATALDDSARPYDWRREEPGKSLTVYVHYSLFEGCYARVEFQEERAMRFSTSRSSEPGSCVGAPTGWEARTRNAHREGVGLRMPLLFSYGTLQEERVQLSTFGRRLRGETDALPGYEPSLVNPRTRGSSRRAAGRTTRTSCRATAPTAAWRARCSRSRTRSSRPPTATRRPRRTSARRWCSLRAGEPGSTCTPVKGRAGVRTAGANLSCLTCPHSCGSVPACRRQR